MIELSPKNYHALLSRVSSESLVYSVLKNGIVEQSHAEGSTEHRVIDILCDPSEAELLIVSANEFWPMAASEIQNSIMGTAEIHRP